jgi:predicted nuclease of predicted toxin-antitoxin system
VKFLLDRCVGVRVSEWLRHHGHDVENAWELGSGPGDAVLLARAVEGNRVLITIATDLGAMIFKEGARHTGLVRCRTFRPSGSRLCSAYCAFIPTILIAARS